jgi:starvation-inducible DNA-binding protein
MPTTRNTLPDPAKRSSIELLNLALAEAIDLHLRAKQAHWNVRGPHFKQLHELFDAVAEGAEDIADTLAERATALAGVADGLAPHVTQRSRLGAFPTGPDVPWRDYVDAVAAALAALGNRARASIESTAQAGDAATSDAFTEVTRDLDKLLWMVESHLA